MSSKNSPQMSRRMKEKINTKALIYTIIAIITFIILAPLFIYFALTDIIFFIIIGVVLGIILIIALFYGLYISFDERF